MSAHRNTPLNLDPINQAALCGLLRSPRTPLAIYRRAQAIQLLAWGTEVGEVARIVGLHRVNVFRFKRRFIQYGVSGLKNAPRQRRSQQTGDTPESTPIQAGPNVAAPEYAATVLIDPA